MPLALASSSTHICTSAERHGNEDISGIIGTIGGGYSLSIGGTIGLVSGRSEKLAAAAWVNESAASILKTRRGNGSAQKVEEGGDRRSLTKELNVGGCGLAEIVRISRVIHLELLPYK